MGTVSHLSVGLGFLVLGLTSAVSATETVAPTAAPLGPRVAEMFRACAVGNSRAVQDSQRIYESLRNESANDPRVDYAYGLVLLKLLKTKDAQTEFLAAARHPGTPYCPAWEALIWSHFNSKDYDNGFDRVLEFAKVTVDPERMPDELRHDEVYWMGRVMSALELILNSPQTRESLLQAETRLTNILGPAWISAYNDGKEDMHIRHALIEDKLRREREKSEEQKSIRREKELERKGKILEATDENRESLKKSAAELKEDIEEQNTAFKKQMQRSEKDLGFLERRASLLTAEMLVLDQQILVAEQASKNQNSAFNSSTAQRLSALINQRLLKDTEFQRVAVLAQEVTINTRLLREQQQEFLEQRQQESATRDQKDKANEKMKERTLKQMADLKKAEANSKRPNPNINVLAARSFRAYIDLDLAIERDKVLGSFGIKPDKK